MKPDPNFREILFMITTSFSQRELCETNSFENKSSLSRTEQLEAACWNGLLDEMLPEIMHTSSGNGKLFLWQVETRTSFLRISMGAHAPAFEKYFALDPHIFLGEHKTN